jgi:uncharacterized glyoxalase superfamily protein PhnB
MQTIFPILRYEDARAAIRWLCSRFGFIEAFSVPESGPTVRHAQLRLGQSIVMVGSVRSEDGLQSPRTVGASTQALCVFVEDVDGHFERAKAAGLEDFRPPMQTDFGAREYHARDIEGHPWTFSNFRPSND